MSDMADDVIFEWNGLEITTNELLLALGIAVMGFVFNLSGWLMFINGFNPVIGTLIYYAIVLLIIFIFSYFKLIAGQFNTNLTSKSLGIAMIYFAAQATINWSNPYVQLVTTGSMNGMSNVFVNNSEDALLWFLVYTVAGITNITLAWFLTFVVLPFIIALAGAALVTGHIHLNL